ncbi:unnamed protein product [Meloidogyne enterolobii]|uniref:Uncharacterized protein n=1 Tax=Meloidogyne enterolobii TaxID=390850 RepID=A0ACB1AU87_MELEN
MTPQTSLSKILKSLCLPYKNVSKINIFQPPLSVTTCCTAFLAPFTRFCIPSFAAFGSFLAMSIAPSTVFSTLRSKESLDECPVEN